MKKKDTIIAIFITLFFICSYAATIKKKESSKIKYFKSKILKSNFVYVKAGTFLMGSDDSELKEEIDDDEAPKHPVKISKGFYIQETETTQKQWQKVMGKNPSANPKCDDCPVNNVSFITIQKFIKKLNKMEKTNKYRLPTEAEWEYAARAGTTTPFAFGNCLNTTDANFNGGVYFKCPPTDKPKGKLMPVKTYKPNDWGIYDMHGNIFEICNDWKQKKYTSELAIDPKGSNNSQNGKSLRGGSYLFNANRARSANRTSTWANGQGGNIGFRLAKSL